MTRSLRPLASRALRGRVRRLRLPSEGQAEALRQSEANYRLLFERNPAPMLIYERGSMRMLAVNDAFLDHYGYSREEALTLLLPDLYPEEEKERIARRAQELKGPAHVGEWHHRRRDGRFITISVRSHDIAFDGRTARIAVITDITEAKQAEADREALQAQLIQAQKMEAIGQLAGGVAHDFNNLLTAMLMHLDLLREETGLPARITRVLGELEREAHRAAGLTRQLLMFSRRQMLQTQRIGLNGLLENLLKMLRRLIGEQIQLEFRPAESELWVEADPGMIEQVIMNLVVNARDAMPAGGLISLRVLPLRLEAPTEAAPELPPGDYAAFTVTDSGSGMDAATLKRIFEPFFTTKEAGKGTGLGLATAFGIVRQHRGWIEVASEPGQGSTFTIALPETGLEAESEGAPALEAPSMPRPGGSILLVEDEPVLREALLTVLKKQGFQVREAENAPQALEIWEAAGTGPDLLISDVVLPGGSTGFELAEELLRAKPTLKVILMSGYNAEMALHGVPTDPRLRFIQKPFAYPALVKLIQEGLGG